MLICSFYCDLSGLWESSLKVFGSSDLIYCPLSDFVLKIPRNSEEIDDGAGALTGSMLYIELRN